MKETDAIEGYTQKIDQTPPPHYKLIISYFFLIRNSIQMETVLLFNGV